MICTERFGAISTKGKKQCDLGELKVYIEAKKACFKQGHLVVSTGGCCGIKIITETTEIK